MKFKAFSSFLLSLAIVALSMSYTFAEGETESEQRIFESISQNCASIKLQLQRTQKEDSCMRVHLGARYETVSTNLMQNLNIRLVRNNKSDPNLAEQQIAFASERDRFKDEFTSYSQELDKLIKIDCKTEPQKFYNKLVLVRSKRDSLYRTTQRLRTIVSTHHSTINTMIEGLNGKE